jgi:hypothetical protein
MIADLDFLLEIKNGLYMMDLLKNLVGTDCGF